MQNEDEQLKTTREGEKVTWSGKERLWSSAVVESGGDSGGVFLPSLLSSVSLLSPLISVFFFPLSSPFLLCLFGAVSYGQVVRYVGGEEARWQLWLFFFSSIFFFPCHFLFFPASVMASLSLLCLLSRSPSFFFSPL
jgi:hypothetical protein